MLHKAVLQGRYHVVARSLNLSHTAGVSTRRHFKPSNQTVSMCRRSLIRTVPPRAFYSDSFPPQNSASSLPNPHLHRRISKWMNDSRWKKKKKVWGSSDFTQARWAETPIHPVPSHLSLSLIAPTLASDTTLSPFPAPNPPKAFPFPFVSIGSLFPRVRPFPVRAWGMPAYRWQEGSTGSNM